MLYFFQSLPPQPPQVAKWREGEHSGAKADLATNIWDAMEPYFLQQVLLKLEITQKKRILWNSYERMHFFISLGEAKVFW
jgi:hypothetical protein